MINEYEWYHGAALRDLIVCASEPLRIEAFKVPGRINAFLLNGVVILYIKHSAKRLAPWRFTFTMENMNEIDRIVESGRILWFALVCGQDGFLALSLDDFKQINPPSLQSACSIRVSRDRGTNYRVFGATGKLPFTRSEGFLMVVTDLLAKSASSR